MDQQAQYRPLTPADQRELHRISAATLRPLAHAYAKMAAINNGQGITARDKDTVNIKVSWLLLRKAYEQWERLIDQACDQ